MDSRDVEPSLKMLVKRRVVALVLLLLVLNGVATALVLGLLYLAGVLAWAWPFAVDLVASFLLGVVSLGMLVVLSRWSRFFQGFMPAELAVLLRWTVMRGDVLGRVVGRTHYHRCNYERGAAMVCSECGAERIDPLPASDGMRDRHGAGDGRA